LRNRFFEALLVLWAATEEPTNALMRWSDEHCDPEPEDGLSAVLPWAATDAISDFYKAGRLSPVGLQKVVDSALDGVYDLIGLWLRAADDDAQYAIAELFVEVPTYWEEPRARVQIRRLSPIIERWLEGDQP
jgi:hypothetical protein